MSKTWQNGDLVHADDMNRIEQSIELAHQKVDDIQIPDVSGLATKNELNAKVTLGQVQDAINAIPPTDLSDYATHDYVINAINQAELSGSDAEVDLSVYALKTDLSSKVDKEAGKGLSTNDFSNTLKEKLDGLENFDPTSINTALSGKVDKVTGKALSTNDFTNALKNKLDGVESGAQKNPDLSGYALKSELQDATQIYIDDVAVVGLKKYKYEVNAVDGTWVVDYSDKGFTQYVDVSFKSVANGTGNSDRTIPTLKQGQPTLTRCEGYLMSATSAGLLAAMTLVNASGKILVTVEGV